MIETLKKFGYIRKGGGQRWAQKTGREGEFRWAHSQREGSPFTEEERAAVERAAREQDDISDDLNFLEIGVKGRGL